MNKKIVLTIIILNLVLIALPISTSYNKNIQFEKSQNEFNLRNIMVTGFWNPTGQMIAQFSNNSYLNPDGWKGENWENLGYNVYSYFPTPDLYNGTFKVDYQDTWNDFWKITSEINPIAIISFGAGSGPWEIEYNARNLINWINDNNPPLKPTPNPPDDSVPIGFVRHSSLPVEEISNAINEQTSINAWIDYNGDPGRFLCEYIAYLGMWYHSIHNTSDMIYPCYSAGFIHVNGNIQLSQAAEAANITIREVINYLNDINKPPFKPIIDGPTTGKINEEYNYSFASIDPECDEISYFIDWGDGSTDGWTRYKPSGEEINTSHMWTDKDTYIIKIKAKDVFNSESDWTILTVKMPKSYNFFSYFPILENFYSYFKNIFNVDSEIITLKEIH